MEGKRRIMLGSNNYLGLTTCPEVLEAGLKALEQYGTGCSGSRFLNGTLKLHLELEAELADFLHKEACCTFSTGFQSNLGILSALVGHGDYVLCDKENHASIYDGCRLSYGRMLTYGAQQHGGIGNPACRRCPRAPVASSSPTACSAWAATWRNSRRSSRLARKYWRARDGGRRPRPRRGRRGRARHGQPSLGWRTRWTSSWARSPSPWPALAVMRVAQRGGHRFHPPQFPALYLLRLHPPGQRRGGAGGAALHPQPSGDRGTGFPRLPPICGGA